MPVRMKRWFGPGLCGVVLLALSSAQAQVIISEFMANTARALADEDGEFVDWIELFNSSAQPVDLGGWHLTDDPGLLTKWTFPNLVLPPGGYRLVFASGKNRTDVSTPPRTNLHTNFRLDAAGGFLALVKPDLTLVYAFAPAYPPQPEDVSFGTAQKQVTVSLLTTSTPQILVPTNAAQWSHNWMEPAFVPGSGWWAGAASPAVGFDTNPVTGPPVNVAPSGTAAQSTTYGSYHASLAINGNLNDFTHTLAADTSPFWQVTLTNEMAIHSVILFNRTSCCGSRLRDIIIEILSTNATGEVTNYRSALLNPENAGYSYPNGPPALTNDLVALTGGPVLGRIVRVRRLPDPDLSGTGGQGNADEPTVLSLGEVVVNATLPGGLRPYFQTDLQTAMWNKNASAFVRLPFSLTNLPDRLQLRVRYDDGFVAWLNGVEVARRNAPATLNWNTAATADRALSNVISPESIDLSWAVPVLVPGSNLLAVQVLNAAASNPDALFAPELFATSLTVASNVFLADPTPGSPNDTDYYLGQVADTRFSVDRGFFDAPFSLEISCTTPGAEIWYSFNCSEPGPGLGGQLYTGPLTITNTTVVRARAFKPGFKPSNVDTHTYLFLADVIHQSPNGEPPPYFPASWGRNRVDYGMDPQVVAKYSLAEWREALTQIPSISIVTEMKNLFDPVIGIYANADGHGEDWERPASIELLDPTNSVPGRFQENCGLRIRGGYSRNPSFVKHSFRVFFRREYGVPKLKYPLFEDEGADEFDTFDLRTSQNYSWPRETSVSNGQNETMVREVFCRESLGRMGQPYRRSRYYHLYLNGHYWGVYETDERPEASFGATYLGGRKEDYDVVKCANHVGGFVTEVTDGNFTTWSNLWTMTRSMATNASNSNYFRILGCNSDGTRNPALPVMLDVDNLIDYMLLIFYTGDGDAVLSSFLGNTRPNNWFGLKNRNNPDQGFVFVNSDCEHTLGAPSSQVDRTGPFRDLPGSNAGNFTYSNPQYMHEELMRNAEYRLRFADRVQRHCFNGGALTLEQATNRFIRKAVQINKAMRAYEARWGDANTARIRYSMTDWTNRINAILTGWFPTRLGVVLDQLRADGLYPTIAAPVFSQFGGEVPEGFVLSLSHSNPSGVIYYTLDGSDPRLVGGAINPAAGVYSTNLVITGNVRVRARVFSGGNWSALTEADFVLPGTLPLRITELMFHPAPLTTAELLAGFTNAEDFEFLELCNVGTRTINLAGVSFVNGISFTFTGGTLGPGQRILLVKNPAAFAFRYGPVGTIAGTYQGNLNNAGERVRMVDALGRTILDFTYSDAWVPVTDGLGFSLCVVNENAPPATWNSLANWRASSAVGGSPGAPNPPPPLLPFVVVNELLSRPAPGDKVAVELANLSDAPADISGWWLSDDFRVPKKFRLPPGTVLAPGGLVVFTEDDFNAPTQGTNAFTFSPAGGEVRLFSADPTGELTGYVQGWDFGAADEGVSFGRHVTSTGADHFVAQAVPTLGQPNAGPRISPIVITEIMYRPPDVAGQDNSLDEFIEVFNRTDTNVHLFDPITGTNTWQLRGGVDLVLPPGLSLGPGQRLLLVNFDPQADPAALARFRTVYGVPESVPIVGPYAGKLDNSGEDIELKRPTLLPTGLWAWVRMDRVRYQDDAPWPGGADGYGLALHRLDPAAYANDPQNWVALPPTAGAGLSPTGTPPQILTQPASRVLGVGWNAALTVQATGSEPLRYLWRHNGVNLLHATNATLELAPVTLAHAGQYRVLVYNAAGSVVSEPATIVVRNPPQILAHPQSVSVRIRPDPSAAPSTNVTFSVSATSPSPLSYQWHFNGRPIPGATNTTLTITNVQAADWGEYYATVTDEIGTVRSESAWLYPLIRPGFAVQPVSQAVPVGSPVTLSVVATGWPPPFTFEWRRGSVGLLTNVQDSLVSFFTFTAPTVVTSQQYRAVLRNAATAGVGSSYATITTLADTDNDGLPDEWELTYRTDPSDPSDRSQDLDRDGLLNWQEYMAGTDPTDPASVLKLQLTFDQAAILQFNAVSNRTYSVQYTEDLGSGQWWTLADIVAAPETRIVTITNVPSGPARFYRLVTPRQP